jgi:hypothetical protein
MSPQPQQHTFTAEWVELRCHGCEGRWHTDTTGYREAHAHTCASPDLEKHRALYKMTLTSSLVAPSHAAISHNGRPLDMRCLSGCYKGSGW